MVLSSSPCWTPRTSGRCATTTPSCRPPCSRTCWPGPTGTSAGPPRRSPRWAALTAWAARDRAPPAASGGRLDLDDLAELGARLVGALPEAFAFFQTLGAGHAARGAHGLVRGHAAGVLPNRRSRSAFATTLMLDSAIAAPASTGLSSPAAAIGTAATLYPNAHARFCRIVRSVARDRRIAS